MAVGAEHGRAARFDDRARTRGEFDGVVQAKPESVAGRSR
jgi:hypothetical protein